MYETLMRKTEDKTMGASILIKDALKSKGITQEEFANMIGKDSQQLRNLLYRDTIRFNTAEEWLNLLGYEIVIKKSRKKTQ